MVMMQISAGFKGKLNNLQLTIHITRGLIKKLNYFVNN